MWYPFVMEPSYKNYIWGGRNLEKLGKRLPEGKIAEAWEASAHPDGPSLVANGPFAGRMNGVLTWIPAGNWFL